MVLLAMPRSSSFFSNLPDLAVMLHHAVRIDAKAGPVLGFDLEPGPDVHAARIEPDKERFLVAVGAVDEIRRCLEEFLVDRFHALLGERPGVLALLFAPGAEAGIVAGRIGRGSHALHDAARTELRPEGWILRIVRILRLVLGIEMVEIAEEFVEAVHGRQEFVAVAEMVLAELAGRIALRLRAGRRWSDRLPTALPLPPGRPTFSSPVRSGLCPVMKAARPAVQDCWP